MLKKGIDDSLSIIKRSSYPRHFLSVSKRHSVILGVGGNVGDTVRRLEKLALYFQNDPMVSLHQTSFILKNPPFGYLEQKDFYNAVMLISTNLSPLKLLKHLLRVEHIFGRKRSFKNAPRTMDLDMIFYDDRSMKSAKLTLPHPSWFLRESVVLPLVSLGDKR